MEVKQIRDRQLILSAIRKNGQNSRSFYDMVYSARVINQK
jgi:hypothetical protein